MQEHDNLRDQPTFVSNTTNASKFQVWLRRISLVFVVGALFGLLFCAGLLVQAYITHKPALELLGAASYKLGFELLGYYSSVFYIAGCLSLVIALNLSAIVGRQKKQIGYISAFIGAGLLLLSFIISFISHKPGWKWWGDFYKATLGTGYFAFSISQLVGSERKRLRSILEFISFVLILAAFVLSFWELSN